MSNPLDILRRKEMPDNNQMIFTKKDSIKHNELPFEIIVKSSRQPLLKMEGYHMHSCAQVIGPDGFEVWHEFYPSILSDIQADRIIDKIKSEPQTYCNEQ